MLCVFLMLKTPGMPISSAQCITQRFKSLDLFWSERDFCFSKREPEVWEMGKWCLFKVLLWQFVSALPCLVFFIPQSKAMLLPFVCCELLKTSWIAGFHLIRRHIKLSGLAFLTFNKCLFLLLPLVVSCPHLHCCIWDIAAMAAAIDEEFTGSGLRLWALQVAGLGRRKKPLWACK